MYFPMYETYDEDTNEYTHGSPPVRISAMHIYKASETGQLVDKNVIMWLTHSLPFATDEEINNQLYQEYHRCYGVYDTPEEQLIEMQSYIDRMRGYWNEYYETTQYEYNPIENYRMTETENRENCSQGESVGQSTNNTSATTDQKQYGYNEKTPTDVQKETVGGKESRQTSQSDRARGKEDRTLTRAGNIGVTTTQQMIGAQRDVLVSVLNEYVHSFLQFIIIK